MQSESNYSNSGLKENNKVVGSTEAFESASIYC